MPNGDEHYCGADRLSGAGGDPFAESSERHGRERGRRDEKRERTDYGD
jgi:hypothetical protein